MKWSLTNLFKKKEKAEPEKPKVEAALEENVSTTDEVVKTTEDVVQTESATAPPAAEAQEEKPGWFKRLRAGLKKTHDRISHSLKAVLTAGRKLDETVIEEVEEILYTADMGPAAVQSICDHLRKAYKERTITDSGQVMEFLKKEIKNDLSQWDLSLNMAETGPTVIMVAGVNGSGKTTSIAKLAYMFRQRDKKVLLAASDTFRAAAVEQLSIWAERVGAKIIRNESADPAAVAFDSADHALARGYDILIVDTAGRLHTRKNLMQELEKIRRVLERKIPGAPHEVLMVLDATTGQNAINQALSFKEAINVTGIILAKLDGTAKGGVVLGMRQQIDIPVKFIGVGEKVEDLAPFDPDKFVEAIFE